MHLQLMTQQRRAHKVHVLRISGLRRGVCPADGPFTAGDWPILLPTWLKGGIASTRAECKAKVHIHIDQ